MAEPRSMREVDLDGISPDEAFSVLGNEIRLDIVRVLWRAGAAREYDEIVDDAGTMSFTELRRAVDVEDNGKFNYHLSQLVPHFVRETDDGYRLSGAGKGIARTVIAVSGIGDFEDAGELDRECPLCSAAMTASYEDQWLRVECTECEGMFGDEMPEGTIYFANYPAGGLSDRAPEEALSTGLYRCMLDLTYMTRGVCRECAGRVSGSVSVCEAHDAGDEPCDACGTTFPAWAERQCETCGFAKRLPVQLFVMGLSPVIGFLDERGIDVLAPTFEEVIGLLEDRFETAVDQDPLRITVTVRGENETLRVTVDDGMTVVDVDRPG